MAKQKNEIRRPEIVAAALRVLNENGLPYASFDAIAQEAGMSRQLLRHYFPEPESLMLAVCDTLAQAYRNAMVKGILKAAATERLPIFLDFYFNLLAGEDLRKPADDAAYDAMFSLASGSRAIRQTLHDQYTLLQHTIAHEIRISNPALPGRACEELGFLFVSLMYGHWKMVATLGFSTDMNQVTRAAVERLIESYNQRYVSEDDD